MSSDDLLSKDSDTEQPFSEPAKDLRALFGDPANLDLWVKEAKQLSPRSKVVTLKCFESLAP